MSARSHAHDIIEDVVDAIAAIRRRDGYHMDWQKAERYQGETKQTATGLPYCQVWMASKSTSLGSTATDVEEVTINGRAIVSQFSNREFNSLDEVVESATQDVYRALRAANYECDMELLRFDTFHDIDEQEVGFGFAATFRYNVNRTTEAEA